MELSTLSTDLKVSEIKPEDGLREYLSLLKSEVEKMQDREESVCPACGSKHVKESFNKFSFSYNRCGDCFSLYVKDRPSQESLSDFYLKSEARRYWIDQIWQKSEKTREAKVFQPIVDWIQNIAASYLPKQGNDLKLAEAFAANPGFSVAWSENYDSPAMIDVQFEGADRWLKSDQIVSAQSAEKYDGILFQDSLDRLNSPINGLKWAREHLVPGGLCFVTGVLSSGLDTLIMGEKLDALTPPDRLNGFSFEGFTQLAERAGFEVIEFSTPGALDLENIRRGIESNQIESAFFDYIFNCRNKEQLIEDFQNFLQLNRLSSRLRAVLKMK